MPNYKVVDADVMDADLSAIGEAIRSKTGGTELLTLEAMPTVIEGIETGGGGDTSIEDGLITGTLSGTYTNDRVEMVKANAFRVCESLQSVSLPNVKTIGDYAFGSCTLLQSVSLPNVKTLGGYAFNKCSALIEAHFPLATCASNPGYMFQYCTNLKSIILPKNTASPYNFFAANCSALEKVDIGSPERIGNQAFQGCTTLKILALRRTSGVCALSATSSFSGSHFYTGGTGGVVLAPTALVENYQTATNWSTLYAAGTCTFLPLEEYTLDGTTTGEIDMAKVEAKLNELYGGATE